MKEQTKNCQNCKTEFRIEPEDFQFYEKMKVPPPTWCPECRMVRRMVWMNHRSLYQRTCDFCQKNGISMFSPEYTGRVYCSICWWLDTFDARECAREYDFSRNFFEQWYELMLAVPARSLNVTYPTLENSEYTSHAASLKNCYLVTATDNNENCAYSTSINGSKDTFDSTYSTECESCYECLDCTRCFKTFFSENCATCNNVWFSKSCVGCADCIGCVNLRNKQYCIFNEQQTKDAYEKKKGELDLSSRISLTNLRKQSRLFWETHPRRFYQGAHNENVTGDEISHSIHALDCFRVTGGTDIKFCQVLLLGTTKEAYDYSIWGMGAELIYESIEIGLGQYNTRFSISSDKDFRDSQYCLNCFTSSNLFGCVSLRNAQYCIFNKQYSKEEYEVLVPEIIEQMNAVPYIDIQGRHYHYGEFFPQCFSPYAYNESMAQEYFPLTKVQADKRGVRWLNAERKIISNAIESSALPDSIAFVPDSFTELTIACKHEQTCNDQCTGAFKITAMELGFYRVMNLPLPDLCPNCRHYKRIKYRNPMKLWARSCMCDKQDHDHLGKCPVQFKTSFTPDRPEIVYCEACYQAEIV